MAKKIANVLKISHDEWLEFRKKGIGGSDAASILGLNPYSSQFALWADKMGLTSPIDDNEAMRQGRDLEDYVARRFCEETGKKVKRNNFMWQHDKFPMMLANVDREIVGENAGLECKTTSVYNKTDFEGGHIPLNYYVQCMHYMGVMGYDKMYLAVLVVGKAFYYFDIERNEQEIETLLQAEFDFWNKYVVTGQEPLADGNLKTADVLKQLYPPENADDQQVLLHQFDLDLKQYEEYQIQIKDLTQKSDCIKNQLIQAMGNSTTGILTDKRITNKVQSRSSIDSKGLKEKYPHIAEEFTQKTEYKVFRIGKL